MGAAAEVVVAVDVGDAMSREVLTVTPERSLAEAARYMADKGVGAALVLDPEQPGPGVVTRRDLLRALAAGLDPKRETVSDHLTASAKFAAPDWSLQQAAEAMIGGRFRHLAVIEGGEPVGVLSMRDVVRHWIEDDAMPSKPIPITEAMTTDLLTVGMDDTLRRAAELMAEGNAGAAVVPVAETGGRPQIVNERVLSECVANGVDVDTATVGDHLSSSLTYSAPDWSLRQAAEAMTSGDFEHILVVDPNRTVGIISMRDVVGRWTEAG